MTPTIRMTVAVLGATGQQGGSVAQELLRYPERYLVRVLTRNATSPKALNLANLGAEIRTADLNDRQSLRPTLDGAQIIFAMTDFWQSMSADVEESQGKSLMDILSSLPQLEHLIWASLPDGRKISDGKYSNIFHWQSKAAVTGYIRDSKPALWEKTTEILFPNYFENCLTAPARYLPVKMNDVYVRSFPLSPGTTLPNVAIEDTGKLVDYVIRHGSTYQTKTIAFSSEELSEAEKAATIGRIYDIPVQYKKITSEEFQAKLTDMDPTTALDFTEQLMIFEDCGMIYNRPEFIQANKLPGLKLKSWDEFVTSNDILTYIIDC